MRASELKVLELLDFRAAEGVIAFHDQPMLLTVADLPPELRPNVPGPTPESLATYGERIPSVTIA
jgi:hypothetical protein